MRGKMPAFRCLPFSRAVDAGDVQGGTATPARARIAAAAAAAAAAPPAATWRRRRGAGGAAT